MRSLYVKKEMNDAVQVLGFRGKIDLYGYCRDLGIRPPVHATVRQLCDALNTRKKGVFTPVHISEARKLIRCGAVNYTWLD